MQLPSLVMVPGLGLGNEDWNPTTRELLRLGVGRERLRVTTLPGYGERTRRGDGVDPRSIGCLLAETVSRSARACVLLGHSSSCQVVVHAAAYEPEHVLGLVLVGPTSDPRAATWPRLVGRWVATAAHETPRQVPALVAQYHRTGLMHMIRVMDAARRDRIDLALADVLCPVLVIRGPHDRIAPADWCRTLGATVTLTRGGHMVPMTDGGLVANEVARFLGYVPDGD
jgi:pimeloyl-ACP methyl ester carboxylesterase